MSTDTYPLGRARVRRIGFGAMQLPGPHVWGPPADREQAIAVLRRALELGVDHIDTAQFYGPDVANELIREALHPYPSELVIATKVGARRDANRGWNPALSPRELREDVHENVRSLGVERLDVVNLRLPEAGLDRELAEVMGPMLELREEGLIDAIGVSAVSAEHFARALELTPLAQVQNLYSVANRAGEDVLRLSERSGVAFVPYFPLGAAWTNDRVLDDPTVLEVAARREATAAQVALAWLLATAENVVLIPGTSSLEHLEENMAAADVRLDARDMAALDAVAG